MENKTMISEHNINEWAERYLNKTLSEQELIQVNRELDADPELYRQWKQTLDILRTFESGAERKEIRNLIQSVAGAESEWNTTEDVVSQEANETVIPFRKYIRTTAAAAGLILFSSLTTMFFMNKKDSKVDQKTFTELKREINNIKNSQSKIIDSLNKNKGGEPLTVDEEEIALYGGTGFALSNDGYIATNYHVVKDANAIYVQTRKGDMKAYIVDSDPNADIAILKLEDKSYRFGKSPLPYTVSKPVSGLGQRVFSIGYPKDEVVYNEGYISCENGYEGDKHSYQLEMTANPGQSGSPVFDKYGSLIGIVTGKQSNTTGTTFAVHADALIDMVQSLPKSAGIHLPENNRLNKLERTEQVKKMRDYVFSVKVN
jgi:S1-C subfamily serine protease